eukprot:TRINITY_DN41211_c0_g1_i1.p1 TRINITY_DN41211_c0_g1~~TRINITY_DN41211_c0_g1_i1.p1  ORF type:complete len:1928 (-),score=287.72 TRINITY_DN41211_c0_g1_i1:320-6103(-)
MTLFLFSGEGVHSADTDISLLKSCSSWKLVQQAIQNLGHEDPEAFFRDNLGNHSAPNSPVVTVALGILNADLWRQWGVEPSIVLGHSIGEVCAAYIAGIFTATEAIQVAQELGLAMADNPGAMLHTEIQRKCLSHIDPALSVASINYVVMRADEVSDDLLSVTLCGPTDAVDSYLAGHAGSTKLRPKHAWHHSSVSKVVRCAPGAEPKCSFVSGVTGKLLAGKLPEQYWQEWTKQTLNLAEALEAAAAHAQTLSRQCAVVEMGASWRHLEAACRATFGVDRLACYVGSMRRGDPTALFVRSQRAVLPGFRTGLETLLKEGIALQLPSRGEVRVDYKETFATQGIASQNLVGLASVLARYFPGIAAHDAYQYNSLEVLVNAWDDAGLCVNNHVGGSSLPASSTELEVLGCGVRLPAGVDSPSAFWALLEKDDTSTAFSKHPQGRMEAAFLDPRFDAMTAKEVAKTAGCSAAEAVSTDIQHALALQLAEEMWADAGEEVAQAAKATPHRVGVYIGAWQSATPRQSPPSAYGVVGSSLSILAARIANTYNLQGPAMTVNTACSSSLVAVDLALRDARAGRIDFAIVGGINLFGDDLHIFEELHQAGMLSPTGRCHSLSAKADGYVRGEGGILFLLHANRQDRAQGFPSHARILGSGVTQNSTQKPITAVDPKAQERAISMACADAGIMPQALAAVELHGTGTSLGDPVEISALARAVGKKDDGEQCVVTAAKMHLGHLESAAGAVGLLKAVMMCEKHQVLGFEVRGGLNPEVEKAMLGASLAPVGKPAILKEDAYVGVSSFGFGGSNAHVVVTATPKQRSLQAYDLPIRYHKVLWQLCAHEPAKDGALDCSSFVVLGVGDLAIELAKMLNTTPVKELSAERPVKHVIFMVAGEEIALETSTLMHNLLIASQQTLTWATAFDSQQPTFWIVSQGAWSVEGGKDLKLVSNPAQAAAWGFSRVLGTEAGKQRLRCFRLDVCPRASPQHAARSVLDELRRQASGDEELAIRGEERFVPRLHELSTPKMRLAYGNNESALITGGLGGLGLLLAEFLLRQCDLGEVVLTSRSTPKPDVSQRLKRLESETGGRVRIETADVSNEDQVRNLLGELQASSKTLVAIYHLAGVLENDAIADLTPDRLTHVMAAKTAGATYLDRHSRALSLKPKHFVLFSSIFALLPFKKNSHYAASNLYLDGLAQFRRGLGFHALSINWGAWSGSGMAHEFGEGWAKYWEDLGMKFCRPDLGLVAMATLLAHEETNGGVFEVDWNTYAAAGLRPATQLMTGLCPKLAAEAGAPSSSSTSKNKCQVSPPRRSTLEAWRITKVIVTQVAELLDCESTDIETHDSFIDAGLDSIMLAQLRTRLQSHLGIDLDGTAVMQNPSVEALAAHILLNQVTSSPAPLDVRDDQLPPSANVLEAIVVQVSEMLDCNPLDVSMEDSFVDAGLDSIMLAQLRTRLQDKLGVDLDGSALGSHPSVNALAAHIMSKLQLPAAQQPSELKTHAAQTAGHVCSPSNSGRNPITNIVLAEVAELLDCNTADLHEKVSFVDAGLDSIMLSQLRTRLQDRMAVSIDGSALMQHPSIAALVAHLGIVTPSPAPPKQASRITDMPASVSTLVVHEDVTIPNGVKLGDFVTIGKGTVLGPDVTIASHAVIGEGVEIGARSHFGPFCTLGNSVKVGTDTVMTSHCHIEGLVVLGNGNRLAAFCHFRGLGYRTRIGHHNNFSSHVTIGLDPENYSTRPPPTGGIEIGNGNCFRESSNVHGPEGKRGGELDGTTRVGNDCYFMNMVHIAHDNIIEDKVTLAPSVMLGGYTRIMYKANVGIGTSVHQYSTIGPFCMVGQHTSLTCDALPYMLVTNRGADGRAVSNMLNVVGLTRSGRATGEEVAELENFYKGTYNARKPWLKDQVPKPTWFSEDMARFDHHRKCQEKQRSVTPICF